MRSTCAIAAVCGVIVSPSEYRGPILPAAIAEAAAAPRRPRLVRADAWGDFSIAPIYSRGLLSAYGAVCGKHVNDGETGVLKCKKQLPLLYRGVLMPEDEARRRVKQWLLFGRVIHGPNERTEHIRAVDPRALPLETDAALDAQL